jgi:ankyrin repeat protein
MIATFNDLCKEQEINSSNPTEDDLKKLVDWCESTISTDISFHGNIQERYEDYESLVTDFLQTFPPNINPDELTVPVDFLDGMTPLQIVVENGLNKYLETLHPSIEQISSEINGITLLHIAAARGLLHTAEALLSLGINLFNNTTKGKQILFATLMLPVEHDEYMIKNKQGIYALLSNLDNNLLQERNESGDTILHTMSVYGYKQLIEDTLAHAQELASIPNNMMRYPIHLAILNSQHECVKVLATVPGVAQLTDSEGCNALHFAAKYGDENMINICLQSEIPKDSTNNRLQTPLMLATIANNCNAVRELIDFGVNVNLTDDYNRSALHYAVEANNLDSVQLLLTVTAIDVNLSDDNSKKPLDLVQLASPVGDKIREMLIHKGASTYCQNEYR